MGFKQYFPSRHLQHIVEYYFYHTNTFDKVSFVNLYSTPILECLAFNFKRTQTKMQYGDKLVDLTAQAYLFGQPVQPVDIAGGHTDFVVVKFKPLGIWRLTGIAMHHISNEIINAEDIFGIPFKLLLDQMQDTESIEQKIALIDVFLQKQIEKQSKIKEQPCVKWTLNLLGQHYGNIDIKTVSEKTCTSRKTLERAFVNQLGILPKLYSRIIRYNFAKAYIEKTASIDWHSLIYQYGYYDQSHFINEFKFFSGKPPHEYYNNHIVISDDLSILLNPELSLLNKSV